MTINFTANLLNRTQIPQRVSWRNYRDTDVSIVELDLDNRLDIEALNLTKNNWINKGARFINHIYDDAVSVNYPDVEKEHCIALTTQNTGFNKLKPNNILGVMMFSETKNPENEITWLEVSPATNKTLNRNREFKNVGTRLVEYVKNTFTSKDIYVHTAYDAEKFYKKNGFSSPDRRIPDKYNMYFRRGKMV